MVPFFICPTIPPTYEPLSTETLALLIHALIVLEISTNPQIPPTLPLPKIVPLL